MGTSRGKIEPSNIKMRAVLMSLAGLLLVASQTEGTMKLMEKMVGEINTHRLKSDCFGEVNKKNYDLAIEGAMEKCMQLAPAFNLLNMLPTSNYTRGTPFDNIQFSNLENLVSLWRTKRDTGLVNVDEDDFMEFLEDLGDFKSDMASKMGNLTCVLTELKLQDPEWWKRLVTGYQDCYDISESIPQTALNKHPLKKMFGRQMMFFKCAEKNDRMNCALGQMKQWLESHYSDSRDMSEYGLPEDQYEAAGLTLMVKYSAASDEEKFLSNFFWGAKW